MTPDYFAQFWALYPRKISKAAAQKAFNRLVKRISPDRIMEVMAARIKSEWRSREARFLPYPATFLNGEDFEERTELIEDDGEPQDVKQFRCESCLPSHTWVASVAPPYFVPGGVMPCPEYMAHLKAKAVSR